MLLLTSLDIALLLPEVSNAETAKKYVWPIGKLLMVYVFTFPKLNGDPG